MAIDWQQVLNELIDRELELAQELGEVLASERDALSTVDPGALDASTARKQACIEELSALDVERRHLCSSTGLTPDRGGMERLLIQADPQGALAERWRTLLARLEYCREANDNNGTVLRMHRRRVTEALGILNGVAANNAIYGDTGEIDDSSGNHVHAEI